MYVAKKKKKQQFVVSRTTGFIIISFFVFIAVATVIKSNDPTEQATIELNTMRYACKEDLLKKLPGPGRAQLDDHQQWAAHRQQDGTVLVRPTGRVQNKSGEYVVSEWNCVVKNDGYSITVLSLEQRGP